MARARTMIMAGMRMTVSRNRLNSMRMKAWRSSLRCIIMACQDLMFQASAAMSMFAHHHDAVAALAPAGPVGELGDVFVVQAEVEELALLDDLLLVVVAPGPGSLRSSSHRVPAGAAA